MNKLAVSTSSKPYSLVTALAALAYIAAYIQPASAAPLYRETFQFCPRVKNGSLDADTLVAWKAIRKGKTLGDGGLLKSSEPGSPNVQLKAFQSKPIGKTSGNTLWTQPASGLTLYTTEFTFDISSIIGVSWDQRFDGLDPVRVERNGSKVAFLIGNTWYISDQVFNVAKRSVWEPRSAVLSSLTFGTSVVSPGIGPNTPANSGLSLPAKGTVSAFGLYIPRVNGRVRIDNFTLNDSNPDGFYGAGEDGDVAPCPDLNSTGNPAPNLFCSEAQLSSLGVLKSRSSSKLKKTIVTGLPGRTLKGMRDQALLSLIIFANPRTDLLTNVIVGDYDVTTGTLNLPATVRPDGFVGAVATTIPIKLNSFARKYMDKYIKRYLRDGNKTKALFPRVDRGTEKLISTTLCSKQFKRLLRLRAEREGIRIKFDF